MRRTLTLAAATAAAALLLPGGPLPVAEAGSAQAAQSRWTAREAAAFWTPERMAAALPVPDPVPVPVADGVPAPVPDPPSAAPAKGGGAADGATAGSPAAAGPPPTGPLPGAPTADAPATGNPAGDDPAATSPAGTGPAGADPAATSPAAASPTGTEPTGTEPAGTEPAPGVAATPAPPEAPASPAGSTPAAPVAPVASPATPGDTTAPAAPGAPVPPPTPASTPTIPTPQSPTGPTAAPLPSPTAPSPSPAPAAPTRAPAGPVLAPATAGVGQDFDGVPAVGRMYVMKGAGAYFCTASVVSSPGRNLVLSAGHCLLGSDTRQVAFVPRYTRAKPRPYGMFPVLRDSAGRSKVWIDQRYRTQGAEKAATLDVAFAAVGPNASGRAVENAVGGNRLLTGATFTHAKVTLIGHPASAARPRVCVNRTTKFTSTDPGSPGSFLRIDCTGYPGGTSGGPFITRFDDRTRTGDVVGVIGGWKTGGPTADTSYSSYFGAEIRKLYQAAVAGAKGA
ncbi:hypothetical protein [Streptomyces sp. NBC_01276]|uniref:hypothetical protein n=1 Tax=Streptomyces sp. NBC_01276 TaxID=2903808 RepID=UPI00352D26F4